jgi:hypothetical protein
MATGDDECPWPIETSCVPNWDTLDPTIQLNATAWAGFILKALTGHRYALCPVTVRPCYVPCGFRTYDTFGVWMQGWGDGGGGMGGSWVPWIDSGEWRNCGGGCWGSCCCGVLCEVWLPGPVSSVSSVLVDNVAVPADSYRIDNGEWLVRTDGDCWPQCSDRGAPPTSTGTFVVSYVRGDGVPLAGQIAGGLLAGEFAQNCLGQECGIPERVRSVSRSGVTFELVSPEDEFENGLTGITEVDRFIRASNPGKLKERPVVWNPDVDVPRMQTWP